MNPPPALDALLPDGLDRLLRTPSRLGTPSAWWGHVPFAGWLVAAARPGLLVELGTHAAVSYAAFCDAVRAEGLGTRCHAVDTWQGDLHAGAYDDAVWREVSAFDASHYAGFSTLHRCTFDAALAGFADGCVDLLHIDGFHTYDAVRHDFDSWAPKLSPGGVVLLHDVAVRQGDFGVWRFFEECAARYPTFAFRHSFGLGVLAVGQAALAPVRALCALAGAEAERTRGAFAALGARWQAEAELRRLQASEARLT